MRSSQQAALHTQSQLPRIFQGQKAPDCTNANQRAWCNFLKSPTGYNVVVLEALASLSGGKGQGCEWQGHCTHSAPVLEHRGSSGQLPEDEAGSRLWPGGYELDLCTQLFGWATLLDPVTSGRSIPAGCHGFSIHTVRTLAGPGSRLTQQLSHEEGQPAGRVLSPH